MFTLAIVESYMDGTDDAASIFQYADSDSVVSEFHYKMWAAMQAENVRAVRMTIQDPYGSVKRFEDWRRPIPPEPEPEPEPNGEVEQ